MISVVRTLKIIFNYNEAIYFITIVWSCGTCLNMLAEVKGQHMELVLSFHLQEASRDGTLVTWLAL